NRLGQREAALESAVRDVVKKNPADAPRLAAMLQEKIVVAPAFVLRIEIVTKRRQRVTAYAMEMHGILGVSVIGRQIHAAAEPPHGIRVGNGLPRSRSETSRVEMDGRRVRIAWMEH